MAIAERLKMSRPIVEKLDLPRPKAQEGSDKLKEENERLKKENDSLKKQVDALRKALVRQAQNMKQRESENKKKGEAVTESATAKFLKELYSS